MSYRLARYGGGRRASDFGVRTTPFERRGSDSCLLNVLQTAPVLWTFDAGADASAIYMDNDKVVVGTKQGTVVQLDLNCIIKRVHELPVAVGSLIKDGGFLYAWCPARWGFQKWKGALFDITNDSPRLIFEVEEVGAWMQLATMHNGMLILGDDKGDLFQFGCNGELVWQKSTDEGCGKALMCDHTGIYFAHKKSICKYGLRNGNRIWQYNASGRHVTCRDGTQDDKYIYVEVSGKVIQLNKETGVVEKEFAPARHRASGVCIGNGMVITGSCPTVLFDQSSGEERYRMNFAGRLSDAHMELHVKTGRLVAAWDKIYCIDLSEDGIARAITNRSVRTFEMSLDGSVQVHPFEIIPVVKETEGGIVVECVEKDGEILVIPRHDEYDDEMYVLFPLALKVPGKKYVVEQLVPSAACAGKENNKGIYRTVGRIKELGEEGEEDQEDRQVDLSVSMVSEKDMSMVEVDGPQTNNEETCDGSEETAEPQLNGDQQE